MSKHEGTMRHALMHSIGISANDLGLSWDYPRTKLEAMTTDELLDLEQRLGAQWDARYER